MNNKKLKTLVQSAFTIFLLAFSFALFASDIQAQTKPNSDLKVMTFNIRYGTANDGENSWQFRRENLFSTIKKFGPEILGLQEALTFQIEEILKQLPNMALIGVGRDDGKQAGEYSCILYDKNRFSADTTETFWFSETPTVPGSKNWGNNITRICTWAKFTDSISKKKFYFYNLHIDHESQPSREKSTEMLISKMNMQKEKLPEILTGDFNCGDTNPAIRTITDSGLNDSYRVLHKKSANEGSFNEFKGVTSGEKIDFIFISKHFKVKAAEIVKDSYNGKFPSDHFPVTTVLVW